MNSPNGNPRATVEFFTADELASALDNLPTTDKPLVLLLITRREIETRNVGSLVERLLILTDTAENVSRLENCVAFAVSDFDSDGRELHEIPAVVSYFRAVAEQFNGWLHFLSTDTECLGVLIRQLVATRTVRIENGQVAVSIESPAELQRLLLHLFRGMNALYEQYDIPLARNVQRTDEIMRYIGRLMS